MSVVDAFGVMFVYLKLTGQVQWSWGVVLIPLWSNLIAHVAVAIHKSWRGEATTTIRPDLLQNKFTGEDEL